MAHLRGLLERWLPSLLSKMYVPDALFRQSPRQGPDQESQPYTTALPQSVSFQCRGNAFQVAGPPCRTLDTCIPLLAQYFSGKRE